MNFKFTWKIWLLIIVLLLSLISIFGLYPGFLQKGVLITHVEPNSLAFEQGLKSGQIISSIDGNTIASLNDYFSAINKKNLGDYSKTEIVTSDGKSFILYSNSSPEITVSSIPNTKIKMGLDLAGGSRALIKAQGRDLTSAEARDLSSIILNRLNVYGLSDMKVSSITDLSGNNYILVEIAGATPEDLKKLIGEQGKFEAKIGNETVFTGGTDEGVASVSRSGQDAGIYQCDNQGSAYYCSFRFGIYLTEKAAKNQGYLTSKLSINVTNPEYLDKSLDLYLDDKLVNSLLISKDLKGSSSPQISISGSGTGATRDLAIANANEEMKQLQTVLITGSLPYKLEIIKLDTISPTLGESFTNIILISGLASIFAVAIVILIRYKHLKFSLALMLTCISEVVIVLGIACFISWNLDLPSIAGIIAGIGTGIDAQIIVLDESKQKTAVSLKEKLKRAFSIILGSYFTAVVSMLPLMWAAAGLFKGFAITSIIGITVGILITRPAFVDMVRLIEEKDEKKQ